MKESVVSKRNPFRKVVCGYDPTQVDSYLFELENKIRAYAANESRISTALINAEDAAQEIKNKAETEAFKLLSEAKTSSANAESRANDIVLKAKKEAAEKLNETSKKISRGQPTGKSLTDNFRS